MAILLKAILGLMTSVFGFLFIKDLKSNPKSFSGRKFQGSLGVGLVTNFLDTLGIGSFAQQTALFKFFRLVDDRIIPGTMNVGNTIPTVAQAFIFMTVVEIDAVTLISVAAAASLGAILGAGIVSRLVRRKIQLGMGFGLLLVGLIILSGLLNLLPIGGEAAGLSGWKLLIMVVLSFIFGALQTIGIGFYAPCMAMVFALGMNPLTAFPLMMTSTALLMLSGSSRFIKENAYDRITAIALTIAGVAGVILAAFFIKSLPLAVLKGIVCFVVFYTSFLMFKSVKSTNKLVHLNDEKNMP
jgi:uncharacterized membrane protein YfcA